MGLLKNYTKLRKILVELERQIAINRDMQSQEEVFATLKPQINQVTVIFNDLKNELKVFRTNLFQGIDQKSININSGSRTKPYPVFLEPAGECTYRDFITLYEMIAKGEERSADHFLEMLGYIINRLDAEILLLNNIKKTVKMI